MIGSKGRWTSQWIGSAERATSENGKLVCWSWDARIPRSSKQHRLRRKLNKGAEVSRGTRKLRRAPPQRLLRRRGTTTRREVEEGASREEIISPRPLLEMPPRTVLNIIATGSTTRTAATVAVIASSSTTRRSQQMRRKPYWIGSLTRSRNLAQDRSRQVRTKEKAQVRQTSRKTRIIESAKSGIDQVPARKVMLASIDMSKEPTRTTRITKGRKRRR
jgi:hypothetical protein